MSTEQVTTTGSLDARATETEVSSGDKQAKQLRTYGIIAIVLVIAAGAFYWYNQAQAEKNEEAAVALARIRPVFEAGEFQKALTADSVPPVGTEKVVGLRVIAEEYSGTDAGKTACLMAANCLVNLGKYSEAKPFFEDAQGSDAAVIRMGALKGLGICTESSNDFAGAADLYAKAAEAGAKTGLEDQCYLFAGLAYEKAGNKEKAVEMFRTVTNKYEKSESLSAAKIGLARLGTAID